jgi:hypothetical protein
VRWMFQERKRGIDGGLTLELVAAFVKSVVKLGERARQKLSEENNKLLCKEGAEVWVFADAAWVPGAAISMVPTGTKKAQHPTTCRAKT